MSDELTPEQIAEQKKQLSDKAVVEISRLAVQLADQTDDPRVKAIEQVCLQQVGSDIRELLRAPQPAEKAQNNRDWMDDHKAHYKALLETMQAEALEGRSTQRELEAMLLQVLKERLKTQ